MDGACLRHTEIPHTTRLFADFVYHFDRVAKYYDVGTPPPFPEERRAALVELLRARNGASPSLDLLAQPGTVAVVTGQQVGLFSGPAYTIYKALTAVKLAEDLTRAGTPAVPIFWLATEDHDFPEVDHAWLFDKNYQPSPLKIGQSVSSGAPVGEIRIAEWPLEAARKTLEIHPFGSEVADVLESAYVPGASMGAAFQALLARLLNGYGLLFLDPMDPAMRRLAAPLVRQAVEIAPELNQALLNRNRELEADGYHAQVHVEDKTSLVFLLEGGRRIALKRQQDEYRFEGNVLSTAELAARAEHLSPNALLRPVVQDYVLPTAMYVGGPAELAYLAQSQVLYQRLLGYMPRPVSRSGFTLLDSRTLKLMDRYKLHMRDLIHSEDELRAHIARELVPAEVENRFADLKRDSALKLQALEQALRSFDPTLAAALNKSGAKIRYQIDKVERKVARETLGRDRKASEDADYLYGGLFPQKHLQERFYSILPFLARHGFDLIDRLYERVNLDCPDHILISV